MSEPRNCRSPGPHLGLYLLVSLCLLAGTIALIQAGGNAPSPVPVRKIVQVPTFLPIELLEVDGKVLGDEDKITFGSPEFADWDGDGRTDLILGYWSSWGIAPGRGAGNGGRVRFFRNTGTAERPAYTDLGDLAAGDGPIRLKEA
jgi:hypothetical protein